MAPTAIPIVTAERTAALLKNIDVMAALRRVFTHLAHGEAVQPAQKVVLLPDCKGDFINYFGVDMAQRRLGVKISPYLVTPDKPLITAWTLLMSAESGMPLMLCDASLLTVERTAATTALAVDLLAPPEARTLTLIGSGAVGRAHLRYVLALRDWREIRVLSRGSAPGADELSRELGLPQGLLKICTRAEEALKNCDVLMLCTSSATPVVEMANLTRPCLITSISTNAPGAHEILPAALNAMDVYCDYRQTTPDSAGEMVRAAAEHGWSRADIRGDLPELVTQACSKPDYSRHVFFRSLGLGLEDLAVADAMLTYLNQQDK
nr:ornithine cyclodeaminase family protein [uncultured Erwinia sp.]